MDTPGLCTPEGNLGHPLSRAELGLAHLSPVFFLLSGKDTLGQPCSKQANTNGAGLGLSSLFSNQLVCSGSEKNTLMHNTASIAIRCGGFIILTGYKPGLGYRYSYSEF